MGDVICALFQLVICYDNSVTDLANILLHVSWIKTQSHSSKISTTNCKRKKTLHWPEVQLFSLTNPFALFTSYTSLCSVKSKKKKRKVIFSLCLFDNSHLLFETKTMHSPILSNKYVQFFSNSVCHHL